MPSAVWPSSLPYKAVSGTHTLQPQPNVSAFKPDVGESIRRRRYQGRAYVENFELPPVTAVQRDQMLLFFNDTLQQGALSFSAPFIDGVARTWWFDEQNPPQFINIKGGSFYRVVLRMGCRR